MRIAIVITRSDLIGGAHMHVLTLARGLLMQKNEVVILVGGRGSFTDMLDRLQIRYIPLRYLNRRINAFKDFLALYELRRVIRNINPDVISAHSSKAGAIARLVGRLERIPTVFTAHGWSFTEGVPRLKRALYFAMEKIYAKFTDRVIAVSIYDRQLALNYRLIDGTRIIAIHNGVEDVEPSLKADPIMSPPSIIMVARFEYQKDHELLLRALQRLIHLDWRMNFVGDGPLRDNAEALSCELGLDGRVSFLGYSGNVEHLLSKAQIFVLTSRWEGLPLSILEGMRCNLPIIASDVGGVNETVVHGHNGFLVPSGDLEALVDKLALLIQDSRLRVDMGRKSRELYEKEFMVDRMVEDTLTVLIGLSSVVP